MMNGVILKKLLGMGSILTKDESQMVQEVTLSSIHSTCVSFLCGKIHDYWTCESLGAINAGPKSGLDFWKKSISKKSTLGTEATNLDLKIFRFFFASVRSGGSWGVRVVLRDFSVCRFPVRFGVGS